MWCLFYHASSTDGIFPMDMTIAESYVCCQPRSQVFSSSRQKRLKRGGSLFNRFWREEERPWKRGWCVVINLASLCFNVVVFLYQDCPGQLLTFKQSRNEQCKTRAPLSSPEITGEWSSYDIFKGKNFRFTCGYDIKKLIFFLFSRILLFS